MAPICMWLMPYKAPSLIFSFLLFTTTCTAAVRGYYFPHSLGEGMEDLETQSPNKAGTPVFWLLDHKVGGTSNGNPSWPRTFSKPQFTHH